MFHRDAPSLRTLGAVAALAMPLLGSSPASAQLQYQTRLQFPVTSAQGDTNIRPFQVWMPSPDTLTFSSSSNFALYENSNGVTNRIVRPFDPLPGLPSGLSPISSSDVGPNGDIWFFGRRSSTDYLYRRVGSSFSQILREGQAAPGVPGTVISLSGGGPFVAPDGTGYVHANVQDAETTNVLWRVQGSSYQPIAQTGQLVPAFAEPLTSAVVSRIFADGSMVVKVQGTTKVGVSILPGDGVSTVASAGIVPSLTGYQPVSVSANGTMLLNTPTTSPSLWRRDPNGDLSEIVRNNGPVSGNPGWTQASNLVGLGAGNNQESVFTGRMGPAGDLRITVAVSHPTGVTPILRSDTPLVGGNFFDSSFKTTEFNLRGQVAIEGMLLIGGVGTPAVYAWDPVAGPMRIAVPGDQLTIDGVTRTVTSAELLRFLSDGNGLGGAGGAGGLLDSGQLMLKVSFAAPNPHTRIVSVFIPTPSGVLALLATPAFVCRRRRWACR